MRRELTCTPAAALDADVERIAGRFAEAQDETVGKFPIFETPRIGSRLKRVRGDPVRAAHVDVEREITALQRAIGNIQESNAAWTAQKLSRGRGKKIAAQPSDIDGDFSDGLAGIHQIRHA